MNRYVSSFIIALSVTASLLLTLYELSQMRYRVSDTQTDKNSLVAFSMLAKATPPAPVDLPKPPVKKEVPKPKPRVEKKPPEPKKEIVKVPEPEPQLPEPEIVAKQEIVEEEHEEIAQESEPQPTISQPLNTPVSEAQVSTLAKADPSEQIDQIKKAFLAHVREKIEYNRHYPKRARMRGIEGVVDVTFHILPDGKVAQISIISGPRIFADAVMAAIEKSFPVSIPPSLENFPMDVTLQIAFELT